MKKYLSLISILILLVVASGCGNKNLNCKKSYNNSSNGIKYKVNINASIIDNKISTATATMDFSNSDDTGKICELKKLSINDDVKIVCKSKQIIIYNYEKLDNNKDISKDKFIKKLENDGFKC